MLSSTVVEAMMIARSSAPTSPSRSALVSLAAMSRCAARGDGTPPGRAATRGS